MRSGPNRGRFSSPLPLAGEGGEASQRSEDAEPGEGGRRNQAPLPPRFARHPLPASRGEGKKVPLSSGFVPVLQCATRVTGASPPVARRRAGENHNKEDKEWFGASCWGQRLLHSLLQRPLTPSRSCSGGTP